MGVKRRIGDLSRESRQKRKPNPIILIICEGKDTEVNYFKEFDSRYTKVDVQIADKKSAGKNKSRKTDPMNLVEKAIEYKKNKYDIQYEDGDRVWCLMDVDINYENSDALNSRIDEIQAAYEKGKKQDIRLGISNPCFELWYLLHYKYTTAHLKNYDAVKDKICKETPMNDYEKNKCVYNLLKDKMDKAIQNANKLKLHHEKDGKKLLNVELDGLNIEDIVKSNPYTNIVDLVEYIENLNHNRE